MHAARANSRITKHAVRGRLRSMPTSKLAHAVKPSRGVQLTDPKAVCCTAILSLPADEAVLAGTLSCPMT
jgi:hypothetical protein